MSPANFQQLANFIWSVADLLRGPYRPPQYERVMLPLTVLRRFDAVLAPTKEAVLARHAELRAKNILNIDAILNNLAKDDEGKALGNETASDHFTPREVIRLMVNLPLEPDTAVLTQAGVIVTICDPACGTGGMLAEAQNWIRAHNEQGIVKVFGQDYNPRSYAVAASDLLIKGHRDSRVEFGNTLLDDPFPGTRFDYLLANPPFGVDWKAEKKVIERDQLEAIVALPEQMFYNTGIGTFIWIVTNRKGEHRKGKIQLIDARERWTPMKRSLGNKRRYLDHSAIDALIREYGRCDGEVKQWVRLDKDGKPLAFAEGPPAELAPEGQRWETRVTSRVFDNADFGYRRIAVLRPLRLRFQLTSDARERFLNTYPELFDAMDLVEDAVGLEPLLDWNLVWETVQKTFKALPDDVEGWSPGAKGTGRRKQFRDCFTMVDPEAVPVIAKHHKVSPLDRAAVFPDQTLPATLDSADLYVLLGLHAAGKGKQVEYEPDPALKDSENIPLKEDILSYFLREVRPYVADAWIDRETLDEQDGGIGKVGYEINFNRVFFQYKEPRPLKEIDAELAEVEQRIMAILREVTE
ncbi:N-6 DNA methylase [uncultured Thiodictyon sp.]|uniref:type I restriction-modification system subunit M n=1 Tax=uncultured Thiodictyon sp. TaxID=1846217 RepID=UPI0025CF31FB|nr:N-6 DNA methylase [uncultured Thiodictyon sp.]